MIILITGINGFIGSALANHFVEAGYDVVGVGRRESLGAHVNAACRYIIADITKPIEKIACDYVIHTAGITDDKASPEDHRLVNVTGTQNVINATVHAKGFIFISSSSVYTFRKKIAYAEADAGNEMHLLSAYGQSKLMAENLVAMHCKQPYLILRPRAVYGPGDTVLLPRLADLVWKNKILLPVHITKKISLTHISNLVAVMSCAVNENRIEDKTFNIADSQTYSLKAAILHLLWVQKGLTPKLISIPAFLWELLIAFNHCFRINQKITRFGSRQLTSEAVMDISKAEQDFKGCFYYNLYS